ncbi:hypothetical protein ISF_09401 [Cordyceps fumosorosea ARSEF 2679]|uniref:DUF7624 domain-containing protein n=1 Tax=Cordyceps fumosorosea (strain ARSEF 2679) TaxID=1081104 RepID=A0A162JVG6_CORFA|nr:hypothetical protein ISF_09401 [Cordyceps fumosorosea ARSEF 2679]OAA49698.1 hypothetical protein ISF_09401 [Cordyceps fumosorosea ARSEF 2679]
MSHQGDLSASTSSPLSPLLFRPRSSPPATGSSSLQPSSANRISSNPNLNQLLSPSDLVGPSPVTSNGTEATEIEDDVADDLLSPQDGDPTQHTELLPLKTTLPDSIRQKGPEEADSVIHAPESFRSWTASDSTTRASQSQTSEKSSPQMDDASLPSSPPNAYHDLPPVKTDLKPARFTLDNSTPRAQDLQDMLAESNRLRSSSTSSLEKIEEQTEAEDDDDDDLYSDGEGLFGRAQLSGQHNEIERLKLLFNTAWACCLEFGSYNARRKKRDLGSSSVSDTHVYAWQTCWKLCERLYNDETSDKDSLNVRDGLNLCRKFCQALFELRPRKDENFDSTLRVSFELNNHLYSGQDNRNLPEEFRERTLDFYVTLCHRLMKQRSVLQDESDRILKACWSLTEVLFSVRQNRREGNPPDENLFVAAIEATYNLSDLFREGLSASRSERSTPRPSQTSFSYHSPPQTGRESRSSNHSSRSKREGSSKGSYQEERPRNPPHVPETPVTEFEDTPVSPESRSPQMPNIMILGPTSDGGRGSRWPSSASNLSNYSHNSNRTSSTTTTTTATEDLNVTRAKILVLRAAVQLGFNKEAIIDIKTGATALQKFVSELQPGAFGSLATHATLLQQYKESILTDVFVPRSSFVLSSRMKRVSVQDLAKSVQAMISTSQARYGYLRELFKFVCSFPLEEADSRRNLIIQV